MKLMLFTLIALSSFSAFSSVTCVTKMRSETGSKILSTKMVTATYNSESGITAELTKLTENRGHKFFAATRETREGTEIMVIKTIPATGAGAVYVMKSFGVDQVRVYDNFVTVKCSID